MAGGVVSPYSTFRARNYRQEHARQTMDAQHAGQTVTADQNQFGRGEQSKDFSQNMDQFGQFFNQYFPKADAAESTSSSAGGGGGAVDGLKTAAGGSGSPATPWVPTMPAPASSSGLAFARAKDQVGNSMLGLTNALRNQFSSRGITGSGVEGRALTQGLLGGNEQLANVATQNAITDTDTLNKQNARQYEGSITQRGQDMSDIASARNADVARRGQDLSYKTSQSQSRDSRMASIMGLWNAFSGGKSRGGLY